MSSFVKIKAGAIQYVLVVSVIIVIVLFAFISLIFLQKRTQLKSELHKEAIHAVYLGFDYLKEHTIPYDTEIKKSFTDYDFESTTMLKKRWGVFDLVIVQTTLKKEIFQKVALMGNVNANRKALYLAENHEPLIVVGTTRITGDVMLPKRGIPTGNIAGVSYYGNKLVYGTINTNADRLPKIQNLEEIRQLIVDPHFENSKYFELEEGAKMNQSFTKETLLFEADGLLQLDQMNLQGNIVILSKTKIQVGRSTHLENVLLIAPEVVIESGVKGSFQVFASKSIVAKENSRLDYPSSLVVFKETNENEVIDQAVLEGIQIDDGAHVKGIVLFHSQKKKEDYKAKVYISEKGQVTGEVYSTDYLELRGRVDGFVYAYKFIAKQAGNVYTNHIYNGVLNATVISKKYNGLFIGKKNTGVSKWVE
ncbi:MAG: hypothetical protein JKY02_00375 [Flavobacteriaceae bacterium]|nr:hypothetical protein [Flavobacteriaceae bacterium]